MTRWTITASLGLWLALLAARPAAAGTGQTLRMRTAKQPGLAQLVLRNVVIAKDGRLVRVNRSLDLPLGIATRLALARRSGAGVRVTGREQGRRKHLRIVSGQGPAALIVERIDGQLWLQFGNGQRFGISRTQRDKASRPFDPISLAAATEGDWFATETWMSADDVHGSLLGNGDYRARLADAAFEGIAPSQLASLPFKRWGDDQPLFRIPARSKRSLAAVKHLAKTLHRLYRAEKGDLPLLRSRPVHFPDAVYADFLYYERVSVKLDAGVSLARIADLLSFGDRKRQARLLKTLQTAQSRGQTRVPLETLLSRFVARQLGKRPNSNSYNGKGAGPNCFGCADSFNRDRARPMHLSQGKMVARLKRDYLLLPPGTTPRLGDIVVVWGVSETYGERFGRDPFACFASAEHAAVYIAPNLLFAKGSQSHFTPYVFEPYAGAIGRYVEDRAPLITVHRLK